MPDLVSMILFILPATKNICACAVSAFNCVDVSTKRKGHRVHISGSGHSTASLLVWREEEEDARRHTRSGKRTRLSSCRPSFLRVFMTCGKPTLGT